MKDITQYINTQVEVVVDRPMYSHHPKYGFVYPVNYGYIPNTVGSDGEPIDAYVLKVEAPVKSFNGKCVAIIHRLDDDDDKLVVVPHDQKDISDKEIRKLTHFQEQFFLSKILRLS